MCARFDLVTSLHTSSKSCCQNYPIIGIAPPFHSINYVSRQPTRIIVVLLNTQDENDNPPIFTQNIYEIVVPENLPPGTVIGSVEATDADVGSNGQVAYSGSLQNLVVINNTTGEVVLLVTPDFETLTMQSIQVSVLLY